MLTGVTGPSVIVRCSALECGSLSHPAAVSLGTTPAALAAKDSGSVLVAGVIRTDKPLDLGLPAHSDRRAARVGFEHLTQLSHRLFMPRKRTSIVL